MISIMLKMFSHTVLVTYWFSFGSYSRWNKFVEIQWTISRSFIQIIVVMVYDRESILFIKLVVFSLFHGKSCLVFEIYSNTNIYFEKNL